MKKLFALLVLGFAILSTCCAPRAVSPAPAPDIVEVRSWRDFELTLHADTEFSDAGRAEILEAAARVRRLTHDRARLTVAFDLDFESVENLKAHKAAGHSMLIGVVSTFPIVDALDASVPGPGKLMGATVSITDASTWVFLVLDRIPSSMFGNVVTHEFGHVIGLPDVDAPGAIMSARHSSGEAPLADWQPADVELCRAFRFCD